MGNKIKNILEQEAKANVIIEQDNVAKMSHQIINNEQDVYSVRNEEGNAVGCNTHYKYVEYAYTDEGIALFVGNTKEELENDKAKYELIKARNGGSLRNATIKIQSAENYVDAEYVPDYSIILDDVEYIVKDKTLRDLEGNKIVDCDDIKSEMSQEVIKELLVARALPLLREQREIKEGDVKECERYDDEYDDEYDEDEDEDCE